MSRPDIVAGRIHDALASVDGICSVTLVGSLAAGHDLSAIGDIDTVVVFDTLTALRFRRAASAIAALTGEDLGFPGHRVRVNTSLGPVKYNEPGQVVVHLMLYDRASHREHALRSPFTCLDWERSDLRWRQRLSDIYPVGCLAPGDFMAARRGLTDYMRDLESGTLSVRRFEFDGDAVIEVADCVPLDRRQQGQFAYHIIRNLVVNLLKMLTGRNQSWDEPALCRDWLELSDLAEWLPFYERVRAMKIGGGHHSLPDTLAQTRAFLDAFQASLQRRIDDAFRLRVVRHGRTSFNDGSFLGTRRDPPLTPFVAAEQHAGGFDAVFSSPLRRAVETAAALAPGRSIRADPRLSEIDYGAAEGLTIGELGERFPQIVQGWERGEDPAFPGGERTDDVLERARTFLASLQAASGSALVVTHNVVLRVMIADLLGLDVRNSYRLPVGHLEPFDICRIGERWLPNWSQAVKARLLDAYVGWPAGE